MSNLYVLSGEIVPKARPRGTPNGRHYLPKNYRDWKDAAIRELRQQHNGMAIAVPVGVEIILIGKHRRRGDADNVAGSLLDALVQAEILADDNLTKIPSLSLRLFYGTDSPRALIRIGAVGGSVPDWAIGETGNHKTDPIINRCPPALTGRTLPLPSQEALAYGQFTEF